MATEKPRFTITLDNETMKRVLLFKEENHLSTQSKAIQSLVKIGLSDSKPLLSSEQESLIAFYDNLNEEGQEKLLDYADDLVQSEKYIKTDSHRLASEA